jgi:acyl carrier protein
MSPSERLDEVICLSLSLPPQRFADELKFGEGFGLDSLDFLDLTLAIEDAFEVKIPEDVLARMETVGHMRAWLETHSC